MRFESTGVINHNGGIDKDAWIDSIIDYCSHFCPDDDLIVFDYGHKGNLKLTVVMDDDTDIRIFVDMLNEADSRMYAVDDGEDWFFKTEIKEIREKLEDIWNKNYEIDY